MNNIKTILVDDEQHARNAIKNIVQLLQLPVEIIGEAASGEEALQLAEEKNPELIFLDIQMPGLSGIDVVKQLKDKKPRIIFITASHDYAIEAFRLSAIDYLLKPIDPLALKEAVEKIISTQHNLQNNQLELLQQAIQNYQKGKTDTAQKLVLSTAEGMYFIAVNEIIRVESLTGYCKFFLKNDKPITVSKNLIEYEELLAPYNFFRVHQSCLVNLSCVKKYVRGDGGQIFLTDGTEVEVARRRKEELLAALGKLNI